MAQFLEQLDMKTSLWHEMAWKNHRTGSLNQPGRPAQNQPSWPPPKANWFRGGYSFDFQVYQGPYQYGQRGSYSGNQPLPNPNYSQYNQEQVNNPNRQFSNQYGRNQFYKRDQSHQLPYRQPLTITAPPNAFAGPPPPQKAGNNKQ